MSRCEQVDAWFEKRRREKGDIYGAFYKENGGIELVVPLGAKPEDYPEELYGYKVSIFPVSPPEAQEDSGMSEILQAVQEMLESEQKRHQGFLDNFGIYSDKGDAIDVWGSYLVETSHSIKLLTHLRDELMAGPPEEHFAVYEAVTDEYLTEILQNQYTTGTNPWQLAVSLAKNKAQTLVLRQLGYKISHLERKGGTT